MYSIRTLNIVPHNSRNKQKQRQPNVLLSICVIIFKTYRNRTALIVQRNTGLVVVFYH